MEDEEIIKAFRVILSDIKACQRELAYAVAYIMPGLAMEGEELRMQALYVLSNVVYWRHPQATEVRAILQRCR